MLCLGAETSNRQDAPALALWSLTPVTNPTSKGWADDASLLLRQRERIEELLFWQLLFCRLFNESAYRHLDLQFFNLFACRNPTSPDEVASSALCLWLRCTINYNISLDK